jgi:hypothetical protein
MRSSIGQVKITGARKDREPDEVSQGLEGLINEMRRCVRPEPTPSNRPSSRRCTISPNGEPVPKEELKLTVSVHRRLAI